MHAGSILWSSTLTHLLFLHSSRIPRHRSSVKLGRKERWLPRESRRSRVETTLFYRSNGSGGYLCIPRESTLRICICVWFGTGPKSVEYRHLELCRPGAAMIARATYSREPSQSSLTHITCAWDPVVRRHFILILRSRLVSPQLDHGSITAFFRQHQLHVWWAVNVRTTVLTPMFQVMISP